MHEKLRHMIVVNHATISPEQSKSTMRLVEAAGGVYIESPILGNPVATANRHDRELGQDDGSTDGSGNFL